MELNQNKQPNAPTQDPRPADKVPEAGASAQPNEAQMWDKVDSLFTVARNAFFQGNSTFLEVLDSLIATLQDMKENEVRPLGGLTQKNKMKLEDQEQPEKEEEPANPNL
ncbi:hypothetical protein C4579_01670 [Candidatus Microgenomates bacterium]|nr:MAG: hypothetical protein C4579_01670 [Candidatus Microgenomates bacterium]